MKLLVLAALFTLAYAKHEQYIGWKSYYVEASTVEQVRELNVLGSKLELDFISPAHVQREAVVLVQPKHQEEFTKNLDKLGIKFTTHADNVKSVLDHEDEIIKDGRKKSVKSMGSGLIPYDSYHRVDMIYAYLSYVGAKHEKNVSIYSRGPTHKKHPLRFMKISTTNFQDKSKPVIFIDGGIHPKEMISPPVVTWAIGKLTEDVTEHDLLKYYDWILFPVVNPDGYEYCIVKDPLWQKTRSVNRYFTSDTCAGVDVNRNFDIFWNKDATSKDPCSKNYPGPHPFSEVETQTVRDLLHEYHTRIALYLSMHSYGSMILYPWGNNSASSHSDSLHRVGVAMANAISKHTLPNFPRYEVGNTAAVLGYKTSGSSTDYAHSIGIPLAYTVKLPGFPKKHDQERKLGYKLEADLIEQVCRETWAGIVVGARRAWQYFKEIHSESDTYVKFKVRIKNLK